MQTTNKPVVVYNAGAEIPKFVVWGLYVASSVPVWIVGFRYNKGMLNTPTYGLKTNVFLSSLAISSLSVGVVIHQISTCIVSKSLYSQITDWLKYGPERIQKLTFTENSQNNSLQFTIKPKRGPAFNCNEEDISIRFVPTDNNSAVITCNTSNSTTREFQPIYEDDRIYPYDEDAWNFLKQKFGMSSCDTINPIKYMLYKRKEHK